MNSIVKIAGNALKATDRIDFKDQKFYFNFFFIDKLTFISDFKQIVDQSKPFVDLNIEIKRYNIIKEQFKSLISQVEPKNTKASEFYFNGDVFPLSVFDFNLFPMINFSFICAPASNCFENTFKKLIYKHFFSNSEIPSEQGSICFKHLHQGFWLFLY